MFHAPGTYRYQTRPPKKIHLFWANLSYIPGGPCHAGYPLEFQHLMNVGYFFGFFVKGLPCHRAFKVGISRMQQSQKSFEPHYFLWFVCYIWLNSKKSFWVFLPWDSWILTGHMPVHRQTTPRVSHTFGRSPLILALMRPFFCSANQERWNPLCMGSPNPTKRALLFQFFFVQPGSFFRYSLQWHISVAPFRVFFFRVQV